MAQFIKPHVPVYKHHNNEQWLIEQFAMNQTFKIYHSVVCKVQREMFDTYGHSSFVADPWRGTETDVVWRAMRITHGVKILFRVIKAVYALRGFQVTPTYMGCFRQDNRLRIKVTIHFNNISIPDLDEFYELPVLTTPVWHPRRFNKGCWSVFEPHKGDCYRTVCQSIDKINRHIRHNLSSLLKNELYGVPGMWINPTDHVRRMCGLKE
jgi:hypothetical protein